MKRRLTIFSCLLILILSLVACKNVSNTTTLSNNNTTTTVNDSNVEFSIRIENNSTYSFKKISDNEYEVTVNIESYQNSYFTIHDLLNEEDVTYSVIKGIDLLTYNTVDGVTRYRFNTVGKYTITFNSLNNTIKVVDSEDWTEFY